MRELIKVFVTIALAELVLWGVGAWSWTSYCFRRWPWLLERYTPIFLVLLVVTVLALRRWRLAREHIGVAGVGGAFGGLVASIAALILAQLITAEDRAVTQNSVNIAGVLTFLYIELSFAFLLALGWLHGAAASMLTSGSDRLERHLQHRSEHRAESAP